MKSPCRLQYCYMVLLVLMFISPAAKSQLIFYGVATDSRVFKAEVHRNNLCIATYFSQCSNKVRDIAVYKDTLYYVNESGELFYTLTLTPSGNCIKIGDFGTYIYGLTADSAGKIYAAGLGTLYEFHKTTGSRLIGQFSSSIGGFDGDLAFYKSKLYLTAMITGSRPALVEVNTTDPSQSTVYMNITTTAILGLVKLQETCSTEGLYLVGKSPVDGNSTALQEIDMNNKVVLAPSCSYSVLFVGAATDYNASINSGATLQIIKMSAACTGANVGSIEFDVINSTGPFTYRLGMESNSSGLFLNLAAGTHPLKVIDQNGCVIIDSLIEIKIADPSVEIQTVSPGCSDTGQIKIVAPAGTNFSYSLNNAPFTNNNLFTNLRSGLYSLTIRDNRGCTKKQDIVLNSAIAGSYNVSTANANCENANGVIAVTTAGMNEPTIVRLNGATSPGNLFTSLAAGTYHLNIFDTKGCSVDTTIMISTTLRPIIASAIISHVCEGQSQTGSLQLLVPGTNTYQLNGGNAGSTGLIENLTPGTYTVRIVNADGCIKDTVVTIKSLLSPILKTTVKMPTCELTDGVVTIQSPGTTVLYSFNNSGFTTRSSYTLLQPGTYNVAVQSQGGCITADSVILKAPECINEIYFPSAFTPNNDGLNDHFKPRAYNSMQYYNLKVFNRFGQIVFETNNVQQGWDGRIKGLPQQSGTYVWYGSYRFRGSGAMQQQKGTMVLLR